MVAFTCKPTFNRHVVGIDKRERETEVRKKGSFTGSVNLLSMCQIEIRKSEDDLRTVEIWFREMGVATDEMFHMPGFITRSDSCCKCFSVKTSVLGTFLFQDDVKINNQDWISK